MNTPQSDLHDVEIDLPPEIVAQIFRYACTCTFSTNFCVSLRTLRLERELLKSQHFSGVRKIPGTVIKLGLFTFFFNGVTMFY